MSRNLQTTSTSVPVSVFLDRRQSIKGKVAGLLDYGYSDLQIADMLTVPVGKVREIMRDNNYKFVDGSTI